MNERPPLKSRYPALAVLAIFSLFMATAGLVWINEAQALRLSMKRIIFEGPKRSDIITIMNNTPREQTYRLGWRHYRMDEQRSLVLVEDAQAVEGVKWADDMISFAPRRVTVPAGGSQQIRVLLRRPRDLAPGEYRSHLWIVTEVEPVPFSDAEKAATQGKQAFRLTMQPALTMPVFVRVGDLTATAEITGAQMTRTGNEGSVRFALNRSGNRSLYGDVKITCTGGGSEYVASHVRGIAVYTEVSRRILEYDFTIPAERANDCRQARIEYIADREDTLYSGQVMAKATVTAN